MRKTWTVLLAMAFVTVLASPGAAAAPVDEGVSLGMMLRATEISRGALYLGVPLPMSATIPLGPRAAIALSVTTYARAKTFQNFPQQNYAGVTGVDLALEPLWYPLAGSGAYAGASVQWDADYLPRLVSGTVDHQYVEHRLRWEALLGLRVGHRWFVGRRLRIDALAVLSLLSIGSSSGLSPVFDPASISPDLGLGLEWAL